MCQRRSRSSAGGLLWVGPFFESMTADLQGPKQRGGGPPGARLLLVAEQLDELLHGDGLLVLERVLLRRQAAAVYQDVSVRCGPAATPAPSAAVRQETHGAAPLQKIVSERSVLLPESGGTGFGACRRQRHKHRLRRSTCESQGRFRL